MSNTDMAGNNHINLLNYDHYYQMSPFDLPKVDIQQKWDYMARLIVSALAPPIGVTVTQCLYGKYFNSVDDY